jgi:hypothetical protein
MAEPRPSSPASPPRPSPGGGERRREGRRAGVGPQTRGPGAPSAAVAAETPRRRRWRDVPVAVRWVLGVLALIVAAVAIFIALFQWNWLRGPIDSYVSGKLNRPVVIHGDLSGKLLTWTPSLTARDLTVAQPAWVKGAPMATLPQLTIAIDLKALLRGKLIVAEVDATRPDVHLLRDASGRNNWTFGPANAPPQPLKLPAIRHFVIEDGHLDLSDVVRALHFTGTVSSNEQVVGYGHGVFSLNGQGTLNREPFTARIEGGPLLNVDPDRPYPFQADIRAGATHLVASGEINRPFDLGAFQATGQIDGPNLAQLYQLTGLALPDSPPYQVSGHLTRKGDRVDLTGLTGRVGSSDVHGHLTVTQANGRPDLTGDLASNRLKLADFTAIIGGAPRSMLRGTVTSPQQQAEAAQLTAEHRILPDARLDVARVRQMDADVRYRAETVDAGPLPIKQVMLRARLDHGLLTLDPLSLILPQGALSGDVRLDARGATPVTQLNLQLAHAQVQELLPRVGGTPPAEGPLAAAARLTGAGASVREAAANANGTVTVVMPGGQMRQLFAEVMGVDVARSLFLYLSKNNSPTPIRCAVAEFRAQNGVLSVQRLLIDTAAVQATGKGVIDLRNETLKLAISGKPKHFRVLHLAAPITLEGRLDDPHAGLDIGKAAPQLAISAALGAVVAPLAAVLPFIAPGAPRDADCTALVAEAQRLGAPVSH